MAAKSYSQDPGRRPAGTRRETSEARNAWPSSDLTAMWLGIPLMNFYFKTWTRWLDQFSPGTRPGTRNAVDPTDDRRREALPWVPQFEATVIPLRRSTDVPGSQAQRLSMRMSMPSLPWAPGTDNVISIDTVVPRPAEDSEDARTQPSNANLGRPSSKS